MATIDLNLLRAAVRVHETGSFTAAARKLGVPRSTVSRAVSALEEVLGAELFKRTTRSVKTTRYGLALFERVDPALRDLEGVLSEVPARADEPAGTLRVTTTPDIAQILLAPVIARFTTRYPDVNVELQLSAELVDLTQQDIDVALRVTRGKLADSALIARKLGVMHLRQYAAPSYLARRGTPKSPTDLQTHDWVGFEGIASIPLPRRVNKTRARRSISCNDMFVLRELLRAGTGIGMLPTFLADADVASGALVRVLPRWVEHTGHVYLVYPSRKHTPSRVVLFRDYVLEALRTRPLSSG
ncbi:MAG: LysR substrate-binding domain-containing protein [Polyangiales bacterium]